MLQKTNLQRRILGSQIYKRHLDAANALQVVAIILINGVCSLLCAYIAPRLTDLDSSRLYAKQGFSIFEDTMYPTAIADTIYSNAIVSDQQKYDSVLQTLSNNTCRSQARSRQYDQIVESQQNRPRIKIKITRQTVLMFCSVATDVIEQRQARSTIQKAIVLTTCLTYIYLISISQYIVNLHLVICQKNRIYSCQSV